MRPPLCKTNHAETPGSHTLATPAAPGDRTYMWTQRLMWIAWPAFLMAGVLEMLVFAMVDPQDLHWFGQPLALSRQGVYTLSLIHI